MFRLIDRSKWLIRLLEKISNFLANNRGFLTVFGIGLIIAGMVLELMNLAFASDVIAVVHILLRNLGIVVALVGILLLVPIGE